MPKNVFAIFAEVKKCVLDCLLMWKILFFVCSYFFLRFIIISKMVSFNFLSDFIIDNFSSVVVFNLLLKMTHMLFTSAKHSETQKWQTTNHLRVYRNFIYSPIEMACGRSFTWKLIEIIYRFILFLKTHRTVASRVVSFDTNANKMLHISCIPVS